jgi:hypothetical protein
MKYIILLLLSLLVLSCSDEQVTNPVLFPIDEASIGVKSKIVYTSDVSQILSIEDFEYNADQLYKKIYYNGNRETIAHYEIFSYNDKGKLLYKLNYYNNLNSPTGFILLDSTAYLYSGDLLSSEKIMAPNSGNYILYDYEYDGKYLIKKSKYYNDEPDSYIIYEYKNSKLFKEINYYKNDIITEHKEYRYYNAALVELVYYNYRNEAKRRVNYSYNNQGKLILEEVDELFEYSSSMPYVVKYFY